MKLTKEEAYKIMFIFLDDLYMKTNSDILGGLLGGFSILIDGSTADAAVWDEWEESMQKETLNNLLSINQTISAINNFLKYYKYHFGFDLDVEITEFNKLSSNKEQFEMYVRNVLTNPQSEERIKFKLLPKDS